MFNLETIGLPVLGHRGLTAAATRTQGRTTMSKKPVIVYGASGYTGLLVVEACARSRRIDKQRIAGTLNHHGYN
jgi:hypothetical protein